MLKSGVFLGKRYEVLERIGSGGMANVYKGKDHKLDRYVAIKVLRSDYRSDEVFVSKFVSEARAAAGLMHPNVVNVYDVGQDRGLYFMVMELVEGITLKDYIEKKGRLSSKETISIAIQMVTGIEAAHKQNIVHRDIKPQNIIISKDGKVKVTDFGIARATTSSNTISANVMGSVHYTSPEQARGGMTDEKSDLYSVGITMYEMITGHVPFDGDSTVTVALKHLQEEIVPPSEEVPNIPNSLESIILKCTQKSPDRRYESAQALIRDLKRALVDPDGNFVALKTIPIGGDTVVITDEDRTRIQKKAGYRDTYEEDDYDDEYDDDDYDDEYDDDDYDDYNDRDNGDVNPGMARIMKILMIVVAAIIAFIALFLVGKAAGVFKFGPSDDKVIEAEDGEMVEIPDVIGKPLDEAIKILNKSGLGYTIEARKESEEFDKGEVMEQSPKAGEEIEINSQIKLVVSNGKEAEEVEVPDVEDMNEAKAQKMLEDAGFVVDFETEYHDDIEEGRVISTDPKAGTKAKEGSKVTMIVSMGVEKVEVPDLKGKTLDDAKKALQKLGLEVGEVTEKNDESIEAGKIISQGTKKGKKVEKGSAVDLVVSIGPKTKMVKVPSLTGKTGDEAAVALQDAGLEIGEVRYGHSNSVSEGYVITQTAAPGSEVEAGTKVGFVISTGPEGPVDTPSNPTDPEQTPETSEN